MTSVVKKGEPEMVLGKVSKAQEKQGLTWRQKARCAASLGIRAGARMIATATPHGRDDGVYPRAEGTSRKEGFCGGNERDHEEAWCRPYGTRDMGGGVTGTDVPGYVR